MIKLHSNVHIRKRLEDWLTKHQQNRTLFRFAVVYGGAGVGKSTLVKDCIENAGLRTITFSDITVKESTFTKLVDEIFHVDITMLLLGRKGKKVIVIKNLGSFSKEQLKKFVELVDKPVRLLSPIVIIMGEKEYNDLSSMLKITHLILYHKPWTHKEVVSLGNEIARSKQKTVSNAYLISLAENLGFNVHSLKNTLELMFASKEISFNSSSKVSLKDRFYSPKETVAKILREPWQMMDRMTGYSAKCIYRNYPKFDVQTQDLLTISDNFSEMNVFLRTLTTNCYWENYDIYTSLSSIVPATCLSGLPFPKKFSFNQTNKGVVKWVNYRYDNYYAVKNILCKKGSEINEYSIRELHRMCPKQLTVKQFINNSFRFDKEDKNHVKKIVKLTKTLKWKPVKSKYFRN